MSPAVTEVTEVSAGGQLPHPSGSVSAIAVIAHGIVEMSTPVGA